MVDLLLRGGILVDGTGALPRRADVAIASDRIAAVGELPASGATRVIDVDGLVVAPGFIDAHTHDDRLLFTDPGMAPKLSQGVTTVVVGNCGISLAPLGRREPVPPLNLVAGGDGPFFDSLADYFAALDREPPAINAAALVGHTTLRAVTMASLDREADASEIDAMRAHVAQALAAGALGVSTGTFYAPARAATRDEVLRILEPMRGTGAVVCSHIRDEGDHVIDSLDEVIGIARELGIRQVVSHHKVQGRTNFGRSKETLAHLEEAALTADVCVDCYPYAASSTVLRVDSARQASRVLVAWSQALPDCAGRFLDDLARDWGLDLEGAIAKLQPAGAIYFSMDEADVERILAHPGTMIGSDGLPHDRFPHPRLWGAFPRVLGHYGRKRGLFPLETAVRKMTGLTAERFGLSDIGFVKPGLRADLAVFDAETVIDTATFENPVSPARGIERVIVGGRIAWEAGESTGSRNGVAFRRRA
ncbi:MAG: D-aminoacylase [Betaproteobacteria bacterium]|nr:D-aminoacylase [Betaproteobacteria bacterium]